MAQPGVEELQRSARELAAQSPVAALELLDRELPRLERQASAGSGPELAPLFSFRAELLRATGQFERARADVERFRELSGADDDPAVDAGVLFLLGTLEAEQGRFGEALDYFHQSRQRAIEADDTLRQSRAYNALGMTLNFAGDQAGARDYFEQALDLARCAGVNFMVATALGNLAAVQAVLESPQAAIDLYREAIAVASAEGRNRSTFIAVQRGSICQQLSELGKLDEAERYCAEALPVLEVAGEIRPLAGLLMVSGDLAARRGELGLALQYYRRSLSAAAGQVPTVEVAVLEKKATLLAAEQQWQAATETYRQLLELRTRMRQQEREDLMRELETRFQVGHRDREIAMLRLEGELQSERIRGRNALLAVSLIALGLAVLAAGGAWQGYRTKSQLETRLATRNTELEEALEKISELARHDSLTGLLNRRALEEEGWQEVWRAKRRLSPIALAAGDVDHFKQVNDTHGHVVGDEVLQQFSARLREAFRATDLVSRWGGEEFVLVLPDSTPDQAVEALERLREDLARRPFETSAGPLRVTVSFGVAEVQGDFDRAIGEADRAMYQAKQEGRDRIVVWAGATP